MELKMPALGQTTEEFVIVEWKKQVGDAVEKGDVLVEVETDKAVTDVESYAEGILAEALFESGDTVRAGEVFARLRPGI